MKQSGIWKAVMSIYNNINDFSCASGKDRKNLYSSWTLFQAMPGVRDFFHDLVEHEHYFSLSG